MEESETLTSSVQVDIPPNHSCAVRMEGRQMTANIPYSAKLSRTNRNGETKAIYITGSYKGVQVRDVRTVVERCVPLANAQPCP